MLFNFLISEVKQVTSIILDQTPGDWPSVIVSDITGGANCEIPKYISKAW